MSDTTKINHLREEIKRDFWSIDKLKHPNRNLRDFYKHNNNIWIENAIKLRNDFPKETNIFLASIYKSNFTFRFILEKAAIVNQTRFSLREKIHFLTDAFENAYHYFGFQTICSNYNKKYVRSLFKKWYVPDLAREFTKRKADKPWRNTSGNIISGKKWVMLNCPLLKFSPINIDILQIIKNADSHKKLAVTKNEVIILGSKKPIQLTSKEITELFNYVRYSISLALYFNIMLAIKYNFWVSPVLIIANPAKFNIQLPKAPKFPADKDKTKQNKKKKKESRKTKMEYWVALGYNLLDFLFKGIWEEILNDEPIINKFLNLYNLRFDKIKFKKFHQEAIYEALTLLIASIDDIKKKLLQEQLDKPSFLLTPETVAQFDYKAFYEDTKNTIIKASKNHDNNMKLLIYFLIPGALAALAPLAKLNESFNQIIIEDKCS